MSEMRRDWTNIMIRADFGSNIYTKCLGAKRYYFVEEYRRICNAHREDRNYEELDALFEEFCTYMNMNQNQEYEKAKAAARTVPLAEFNSKILNTANKDKYVGRRAA